MIDEKEQLELMRETYNWLLGLKRSGDSKLMRAFGFTDIRSLDAYIEFKKEQGIKLSEKLNQN